MNDAKYIGLDVYQAPVLAVVLDSAGKQRMESILETKALYAVISAVAHYSIYFAPFALYRRAGNKKRKC